MPGTAEKLAVLAARAAAGERLWHPMDPVIVDERKQLRHHTRPFKLVAVMR